MLLTILIIILAVICMIIHQYLNGFWVNGLLPYTREFLFLVRIFISIQFISFIWIFGFVFGSIIAVLYLFGLIHSTFLWPFLLRRLISIHKQKSTSELFTELSEPNSLIYICFICIIPIIGILTTINFFVFDYALLTHVLIDFFDGDYITPLLWLLGFAIVSNIIRHCLLIFFLNKSEPKFNFFEMGIEKKIKTQNPMDKEVKEILDEIEIKIKENCNITSGFKILVRLEVEHNIRENVRHFFELKLEGYPIRKYVYCMIVDIAIEISKDTRFQGRHDQELIKICDFTLDELLKFEYINENFAKEKREAICENI